MKELSSIHVAFLISQYPAVSHTFVQREILALRTKGFIIDVASINEPNIALEQMLPIDREEYKNTFYIKKQGGLKAAASILKRLILHPLSFLKGTFFSIALAKTDIKKALYHLFYLAEAVLLGDWMKNKGIRHVHVHFANPASTVAMILCKIYPFTFSMTIHGPDEFYDVTLNYLKQKGEEAAFIFCISNYALSQILRISGHDIEHKTKVIRLGVDSELYLPIAIRENHNPIEILCVGRLAETKGQYILIEAIRVLIEEGRKVRLKLVGDGPERPFLERHVISSGLQDKIVFMGALNPEKTLDVYKSTDIFALTSFAEGLPVVLMEAMSMEIPCIATAINGIPELIINEENGLLVPPADVQATAQAITRLIDDVSLRRKIGKAGRMTILEKYNIRANSENLAQNFVKKLKNLPKGN